MRKEKSLVNNILMHVFMVTIAIVTIVLVVVWLIVCRSYFYGVRIDVQAAVAGKAEELQFKLEKQINKTDHITGNVEIIEKLDVLYDDGYALLSFINEFNTFIDALEYEPGTAPEGILVYTSNPTLVESDYLRRIERLEEKTVLNRFSEEKENFYWDNKIYEDSMNRQYIVIYRYLPIEYECIIEIKLYFDGEIKNSDYIDNCELLLKDDAPEAGKYSVTEDVFEKFSLEAQLPKKPLYIKYGIYLMQLMMFAVVFLVAAYYLAATAIRHALKDIMLLVEQIDENEFLIENAKESKWTELRKIQNSIFSLNRQIYDMHRDRYESQLLQKKLEIENLNLKINPHLLYNSLSVIKMDAFKKGDRETEEIVDLLVGYYRLMLNKGEEFIMLGQELEYLEKYIKIHEISKKIKYDVEIDISSDAYELMIPHLILQPIVENAVFHGLGQNTQNPEISFFVSYKENTLVIEINDNGIGIEPEKLSLMNNKEALGYGLSNVVFRLDFYYGENYSLEFFSKDMKGTSVVMTIKNTDGLKLQN